MGIFKKINFGLRKTRNNVSGAIDNVLDSYTSIDQELFDELEEALVMGDVGVTTASEITLRLNDVVRKKGIKNTPQQGVLLCRIMFLIRNKKASDLLLTPLSLFNHRTR